MFKRLKLKDRFQEQWSILNDTVDSNNNTYCFIELKTKLASNMNHSLVLVSNIICWEKNEVIEIEAYDDTYVFTDNKNKNTLVSSEKIGDITKEVNVMYLKEIIEEICNCKFE